MGWPVRSLCQMAAVRARMRCRDAGEYPGRGVSAVAFEVELAFEGDRLDDLVQRLKNWLPGPPGSPWRARHSRCSPAGAGAVSKSRAVVVLIADQHLAGQQGGQLRVVEDGQQRLPLISPALASANPTGRPCSVHSRCSRSP